MIPTDEVTLLTVTIADAFAALDRGERARGYRLLLAGEEYAQQAGQRGERWAADVRRYYERARELFMSRSGDIWADGPPLPLLTQAA